MMSKRKRKKGFTLIELVIVLAVLAIIALIAIPNFNKVRTDSQKKADNATCDVIERVTTMAIAEGYFERKGEGTAEISITFDNAGAMNAITLAPEKFDVSTINTVAGDVAYKAGLDEVKKPQVKGQVRYVVTIDANDNVTKVETKPAAA
ncbi:MAG: competence type IV pilus major pilin ComGC [Sarcina sp.]